MFACSVRSVASAVGASGDPGHRVLRGLNFFLLALLPILASPSSAFAQNRPPEFDFSDIISQRSLIEEIANLLATPFATISSFMLLANDFQTLLAGGAAIAITGCLVVGLVRKPVLRERRQGSPDTAGFAPRVPTMDGREAALRDAEGGGSQIHSAASSAPISCQGAPPEQTAAVTEEPKSPAT